MSMVGFRAKNHRQQTAKRGALDHVDERITPAEIFDPLNRRHLFSLDAAASASNTKCLRYYDAQTNGLAHSWAGERVWCNPPYSNLPAWVEKAWESTLMGGAHVVVMLLPSNRTEQAWWQQFIEPFRERHVSTVFLRGRRRFGWPEGRVVPKKGDRPPFGLVVATFWGCEMIGGG